MRKMLVLISFLIGILGCEKEETPSPYKQNLELKSKLQGSWVWEEGTINTSSYRVIELEFIDNGTWWYDSLVTRTWTERKKGSAKVLYGYNNGTVPPIGRGLIAGWWADLFLEFDFDELLWVDDGKYQGNRYEGGTLTYSIGGIRGEAIESSTAEFDSTLNQVEFCHPWLNGDTDCFQFKRVE